MANKFDYPEEPELGGISMSGGIYISEKKETALPVNNDPDGTAESAYLDTLDPDGTAESAYLDTLDPDAGEQPGKKDKPKAKWSKRDRITVTVLGALNAAVFLFIGIFLMVTDGGDPYQAIKEKAAFDPLTDYYNSASIFKGLNAYVKGVDFPEGIRSEYMNLYSENTDTVGWLRIPGTSIDGPIVKGKTNEEYERTDFYKQPDDRTRLFFMDFRNPVTANTSGLSNVTIVYGHHLSEDECIFAEVEDYMDVNYYKTHPMIEMNTLYRDYQWKVFACFVTTVNEKDDAGNVFYYWNPYVKNNEVPAFANECLSRSYFVNPAVDIIEGDKLLLLSTCTYIFNRDRFISARCVLCARLLRNGEKPEVNTDGAYANENRRMPHIYYQQAGLNNPYLSTPVFQSVTEQ